MRVFVIGTGRCGTKSFAEACKHISNYTVAHESRVRDIRAMREFEYPDNHIEVDPHLHWFIPLLKKKYPDAFWVHLIRDRGACVESLRRRDSMNDYSRLVCMAQGDRDAAARLYYDATVAKIRALLPDALVLRLETLQSAFRTFWDRIGAEGDYWATKRALEVRHNATVTSGPVSYQSTVIRGIEFVRKPLEWWAGKIEKGEPFSYARYGDGEWLMILGERTEAGGGSNADGHRYFDDLAEALRRTVEHPGTHYYGMPEHCLHTKRTERIAEKAKGITWYSCDVFNRANERGELFPLVRALRGKPCFLVGPAALRPAIGRLDLNHVLSLSVETPERDAWLEYERVKEECQNVAQFNAKAAKPIPIIFLLSVGMMAGVLIHDLSRRFGEVHTFLDCGSLWDIYAGRTSRSYMKRIDEEMIRRNVNGD